MEHVTMLDIIIIFAYLLGMLWVGFYFTKRVKTSGDFFVAGRTLGPVVLMATVCASIIGGSALIGRGGYAYNGGMVAIAIALPYMVGMFFSPSLPAASRILDESTTLLPFPNCWSTALEKSQSCWPVL